LPEYVQARIIHNVHKVLLGSILKQALGSAFSFFQALPIPLPAPVTSATLLFAVISVSASQSDPPDWNQPLCQGASTASGVIDGTGYLGAVLAGDAMARISISFGWSGFFIVLAGVALLTSTAAGVYWVSQRSVQ
jgi:hypothetical protein